MAPSTRPRRGMALAVAGLLAAAGALFLNHLEGPAFAGKMATTGGLSVRPQPPTESQRSLVAMRYDRRGQKRILRILGARGDRAKGIKNRRWRSVDVFNALLPEEDVQKHMWYSAFLRKNASRLDGMYDADEYCEYYHGRQFHVNRKTQVWRLDKDSPRPDGYPETGMWSKDFRMPMEGPDGYTKREPRLRREWKSLVKKWRKKYGAGQKWANGKAVYLSRLQHIPYTREAYGDMYGKKAEWLLSPKEVENKRRLLEAKRLRRRLEAEAELMRLARLKDLDVWAGEQKWRRPWQPKIDLETGTLMEELDDEPIEWRGAAPEPEPVGADADDEDEESE